MSGSNIILMRENVQRSLFFLEMKRRQISDSFHSVINEKGYNTVGIKIELLSGKTVRIAIQGSSQHAPIKFQS